MAIELIIEGKLEKPEEKDGFNEFLKEICDDKKIKMEDYDTSVVMDICPEGSVECSYEGVYLRIVAQTNVAGPGFHAFVATLFDDIVLKSGLELEVIDPTQYYENRDFEDLKYKHFYPWLHQICDYVKERGMIDKNVCICWSLDEYRPEHKEGYVVTPLGYRSIQEFAQDDIEELAETFFLWNHQKKDAQYYRNCAYALLWKQCFFDYSLMNDYTSKIANMCIDYIEASYEEDSTIDLPFDIYESLCECIGREKNIHSSTISVLKHQIGYRKGRVSYPLGNWHIAVQGCQEKTWDEVTQTMNIMAPYKSDDEPWSWLIKANVLSDCDSRQQWMKQNPTYFTFEQPTSLGFGVVLHEEDYYRLLVCLQHQEEMLQLDCFIHYEKDIALLQKWCQYCTYEESESNILTQ